MSVLLESLSAWPATASISLLDYLACRSGSRVGIINLPISRKFGIELPLTKLMNPNKLCGLWSNWRMSDVIKSHRLDLALGLQQALLHYVALYNHHLPGSAVTGKAPV